MDCKWNFRKLSTSHYASFCSAPARVISDPRRAAKCAPLLSWIFTRQQIKNRCGRALGEWSGGWPVSDALKLNNWIEFRTSGTVDTSGDSIFGVCWLFRLHKVARFYKIKMKFDFEGCEEKDNHSEGRCRQGAITKIDLWDNIRFGGHRVIDVTGSGRRQTA